MNASIDSDMGNGFKENFIISYKYPYNVQAKRDIETEYK